MDILQLSNGYKTPLSLVIDLAIRIALANPEVKYPLESVSGVFIDEIDLHLHPEWQRRVVGDLLRTSPKTQFLLTTHSPFIIEAVNNQLQRHHILNIPTSDKDIKTIDPLSPVLSKHISFKRRTKPPC